MAIPDTLFGVGQSKLPFARFVFDGESETIEFDYISDKDIVFEAQETWENYGTEDPRVAYRALDKTYYMMYSAVE